MNDKSKRSPSAPSKRSYLDLEDQALIAQCAVDTYRASGPGGQKRNKTASAVRLRHQPTGVIVKAEESRSQHQNKAKALKRLKQAIALHVRRQADPDSYQPSELLRSCITQAGKLHIGRRDQRYNSAVWEILDVFHASKMQLSTTAGLIGVSTANLSSLLREDPALWRKVNEMRHAANLKSLK